MSRYCPQRVLMAADTVGGVWTYALELARALAAAGVKLGLATMGAALTERQRREIADVDSTALEELADPVVLAEYSGRAQATAGIYTPEAMSRLYLRAYSKLLKSEAKPEDIESEAGLPANSTKEPSHRRTRSELPVCAS